MTDDIADSEKTSGKTLAGATATPRLVLPNVGLAAAVSVGVIIGIAFAGWTFSGDLLLNWDQVIGRRVPMPPGFYGEGPELPRRLPLFVFISVASRIIGGPAAVGLLLISSTTAAVAGLHRRAGGDLSALVVAAGYGLSPFLLTRGAVGHLPIVVAAAILPWALDAFESGDRRRVLIWATAFGLTGPSGAILGFLPAVLAVVSNPGSWYSRARDLLLLGLTQLTWVAPGLVVLSNGGSYPTTPTAAFATRTSGLGGILRLGVGGGFFIGPEDVADRAGLSASILGLAMAVAGVVGLVQRRRLDVLAKSAIAAAVVIAASIEGVGSYGWQQLTAAGPLGVAREAQKLWPLVAVALAIGAAQLIRGLAARRFGLVVAAACLIGLSLFQITAAWPGLFGADGRLVAAPAPASWLAIEAALDEADSTATGLDGQPAVLGAALPWVRYERLALSDNRNVLQPAPWLLSSRVLISGDPGLAAGDSERLDPIHDRMVTLDLAVRAGAAIAPELRELGVSHVLVAGSKDAPLYARIGKESGVTAVVEDAEYALYDLGQRPPTDRATTVGVPKKSRLLMVLAGGPTVLATLRLAIMLAGTIPFSIRPHRVTRGTK